MNILGPFWNNEPLMHIHCLGFNHTTSSVNHREHFHFSTEKIEALTPLIQGSEQYQEIKELVILSTCNRMEMYAVTAKPAADALVSMLEDVSGIAAEVFLRNMYQFKDEQSVQHLMQVACGLDSLVIGESQILGQVGTAIDTACSAGLAGSMLTRLFQRAIHAGKRARTETCISRHNASIPSLAASLVQDQLGDLAQAQVLVLGAGEMAEVAMEALIKRGATSILVLNRTLENARKLASRWQANAGDLSLLQGALESVDIIIASTSARRPILNPGMIMEAMLIRQNKPVLMIDIAVPRNIHPECSRIPGVILYDMDGLQASLESSLTKRQAEIPMVNNIIAEELLQFMEYYRSLQILPLIAEVHQKAEAIRHAELAKTLKRLPGLDQNEISHIEAMTSALVSKLLEAPTSQLKANANTDQSSQIASLVRSLFDLPSFEQ